MSIISKSKTLIRILKTRGLMGFFQAINSKLDRSYRPDENEIVFHLLVNSDQPSLMIDVGAHHGSSLAPFAEQGWQILAFEPDSINREALSQNFASYSNVIIDHHACSDQIQPEATLYSSAESTGVSGLSAFLDSHQASEKVPVTTLADALESYALSDRTVDYLKVDTEGFDLMVLKGYPWETGQHPRVILCEFEDTKTQPLGYRFDDLANFLVKHDYQLMVSEWYPVKVYGGVHRWRGFAPYPYQLADPNSWGNIFAVKHNALFKQLQRHLQLETDSA